MINWHFLKVGWLGFNDAFNTDWVKALKATISLYRLYDAITGSIIDYTQ